MVLNDLISQPRVGFDPPITYFIWAFLTAQKFQHNVYGRRFKSSNPCGEAAAARCVRPARHHRLPRPTAVSARRPPPATASGVRRPQPPPCTGRRRAQLQPWAPPPRPGPAASPAARTLTPPSCRPHRLAGLPPRTPSLLCPPELGKKRTPASSDRAGAASTHSFQSPAGSQSPASPERGGEEKEERGEGEYQDEPGRGRGDRDGELELLHAGLTVTASWSFCITRAGWPQGPAAVARRLLLHQREEAGSKNNAARAMDGW
ncbi:hypothetical protein C2845_PM15G21570 [Panicum miliaceum]|uniref:Uncharacterized protein n=1 Tax=Panicum miliaceum TaxID=4540 RepID=A0A3L6QCP0_PANMI|nr:hypothetical protein C2845_PM15G21570 [Panicum miliaceum]